MAARQPALTVLQLDTRFPRVPGDVACADTYTSPPEILRIPRATVARVVTDRPAEVEIAPFETAAASAAGRVIATSCGFLAPHRDRLARAAGRPVIASALDILPRLVARHGAGGVLVVTFDARSLTAAHLGAAAGVDVAGLPPDSHLRRVIASDAPELDAARAAAEVAALVAAHLRPAHRQILLECTNLPPAKPAIRAVTALPIADVLTCIEAARPGTVRPAFL